MQRSKSLIHWPENKSIMETTKSKTPVRKSDQWHRLASVVKSTRQSCVPGSPQHFALSAMKLRAKLGNSSTIQSDVLSSQKPSTNQSCAHDSPSKIRSLSSSYALLVANQSEAKRSFRDTDTESKRDIDGSGDSSNVLPKRKQPYNFQTKTKRSTVSFSKQCESKDIFNPYSLQYLIFVGFVLLIGFIFALITSDLYSNNSGQRVSVVRTLTEQDIFLLRRNFKEKLFGQHIAVKIISDFIDKLLPQTFLKVSSPKLSDAESHLHQSKIAVFSLHGWTGVGKTFLNKILVNSLKPERYLQFIVPIHYPHSINDDIYKTSILHSVTSNVSQSAINVITFDEMDKASARVLNGIANAIQQLKFDSSYKDSTIIVLLISNTHGQDLNKRLFQLLDKGFSRDKLTLSDFYSVFHDPSVDVTAGATRTPHWYNLFTDRNLIDSFVPFLPLNHFHVEQCIRKSLAMKGLDPTNNIISKIFDDLSLFQPPGSIFQYSHTGCKRVSEKVDLHCEPLF